MVSQFKKTLSSVLHAVVTLKLKVSDFCTKLVRLNNEGKF